MFAGELDIAGDDVAAVDGLVHVEPRLGVPGHLRGQSGAGDPGSRGAWSRQHHPGGGLQGRVSVCRSCSPVGQGGELLVQDVDSLLGSLSPLSPTGGGSRSWT